MKIRKAHESDYEQIMSIRGLTLNNFNLINSPDKLAENGFLVGDYPYSDFVRDLDEIFLVCIEEAKVVGYIIVSKQKEYIDNENKIWENDNVKKLYYSAKSLELNTICVAEGFHGKGIGSQLLLNAIKNIKQEYRALFSIVTKTPILNKVSYDFHLKHQFSMVADSSPSKLFGIDDYSSILMMRSL